MGLGLECLPKLEELFLQIEERKVERYSALNLSQPKHKYTNMELFYSSKNCQLLQILPIIHVPDFGWAEKCYFLHGYPVSSIHTFRY